MQLNKSKIFCANMAISFLGKKMCLIHTQLKNLKKNLNYKITLKNSSFTIKRIKYFLKLFMLTQFPPLSQNK